MRSFPPSVWCCLLLLWCCWPAASAVLTGLSFSGGVYVQAGESKAGGGGAQGLVGKVEVSLAPLADGDAVLDSFDVTDETGKKAGKIRVRGEQGGRPGHGVF